MEVEEWPEIPEVPDLFPDETEDLDAEERKVEAELAKWHKDINILRKETLTALGVEVTGELEDIEDPEAFIKDLDSIVEELETTRKEEVYKSYSDALETFESTDLDENKELLEKYIELTSLQSKIEADINLGDHREEVIARAKSIAYLWHQALSTGVLIPVRTAMQEIKWPNQKDDADFSSLRSASSRALKIYVNGIDPILNIFQVLAEPIKARFLYHFDSKRPTNRLDKPEWFLQHITLLVQQQTTCLIIHFQPLLDEILPTWNLLATHEMIRALLPTIIAKLQSNSQQLLDDIDLLTHTIAESKSFDDVLRDDFGYRDREGRFWKGTAYDLLSDEVFNTWLQAEDEFVKSRYHEIVDDPEAFEIIADSDSTSCEVIPNPASLKMIDLFEAMTRQFRPVDNIEQRKSFVETIQITLLTSFIEKVRQSTDIFEELTTGFSGGYPAADMSGTNGLARLCRQISGIANIHDKLMEWSNDAFYVDLDIEEDIGCFDAQLKDYKDLRMRIQGLLSSHIEQELIAALKGYTKVHTWQSDETPSTQVAATNPTSVQLIPVFEVINDLFLHIKKYFSPILMHKIYRKVASSIDQYLWTNIILRHKFSKRGALQLKRDIWELWATFLPFVARPEQGMRRLNDTLTLLGTGIDEEEKQKLRDINGAHGTAELRIAGILVLTVHEAATVQGSRLFEPDLNRS